MIRYITLHICKEWSDESNRFEVDVVMADSGNPYPDIAKIKSFIHTAYNIKGYDNYRMLKVISNKIARYVFKCYPYVLSIKLRVINENGEMVELNLEEEVITDREA